MSVVKGSVNYAHSSSYLNNFTLKSYRSVKLDKVKKTKLFSVSLLVF